VIAVPFLQPVNVGLNLETRTTILSIWGFRMQEQPISDLFKKDLKRLISQYTYGELTFAEAIGVIEIVKLELWLSQNDEDRSFKNPDGYADDGEPIG